MSRDMPSSSIHTEQPGAAGQAWLRSAVFAALGSAGLGLLDDPDAL